MNTKIRFLGPAVLMLLLVSPMAGAQEPEERIGSAMARAQEAGVPVWLLESKIQEGHAKGVPMERIAQAVEARLNGLSRAAAVMEGAPGGVDAAQLSLGADALGVGVSEAVLAEIAASAPGEHRAVAIAALAHLVQQGTVPAEALARVQAALAQGPAGLANLPGAAGPPFGTPVPGRGGPPEGVQTGPPSWVPAPGQSGPPGLPPGRRPPGGPPGGPPTGGGGGA
jgi:hypothetical protein